MSIIIASCVISLSIGVEASRRVKVGNSSLGCRERFDFLIEIRVAQRKRGGP